MTKVLGIETSCDETAVSIVEDGTEVLVNLIASQSKIHELFGGVYPEIASRHHVDQLMPLVAKAVDGHRIDVVAVTSGPGLMGALLVGVAGARALAYGWNLPIVGVSHIDAHLYSAMMAEPPCFPGLGVVVSGGHTLLAKMDGICDYEVIATTVDDAVGEAFDKVATLLGYSYPGGACIERLAVEGAGNRYSFRGGRVKGRPLDFSFSGLKTSVRYLVQGIGKGGGEGSIDLASQAKHIAASFQRAALEDVVDKALAAAATFPCRAIYCGGGVAQNKQLRRYFKRASYPVFYPPPGLCCDNGAMIAGLGYHLYKRNKHLQPICAYPRMHAGT